MNFNIDQIMSLKDIALGFLVKNVPQFILALIILWVGLKLIKRVTKLINSTLTKGHFDITIAKFTSNLINFGLKGLLIITIAGMVGIETTSFVAIIGAAGLAVGLALQGSLTNFAGGMLILLFKPYQVGDWIEAEGEMGKVDEIDILLTRLITRDNKVIIIPNGQTANGKIINWSKAGPVRVEIPVGVSYDTDLDTAKNLLLSVVKKDPLIKKNPQPTVSLIELADSSLNLVIRGYCSPQDYPIAYSSVMESSKKALDKENIEIPFPQRVVHMVNKS